MTERTLICKLRGSLMCLFYIFDMLAKGVGSTRHWHMAELHVCTVQKNHYSRLCEISMEVYHSGSITLVICTNSRGSEGVYMAPLQPKDLYRMFV